MPRRSLYPNRPDKHCPECEIEYVELATVCSDCGGELTWGALPESLPPLPFSDDLIRVAGGETLLMKALVSELNEAGIPHHLAQDPDAPRFTNIYGVPNGYDPLKAFAGADPYITPSWSLLVQPDDAETARQLVAQHDEWMDADYVSDVIAESERSSASTWAQPNAIRRLSIRTILVSALAYALFRLVPLPYETAQDVGIGLATLGFWLGISLFSATLLPQNKREETDE